MNFVVSKVQNSRHEEGQPSDNQHDVERSPGEAIDILNLIIPVVQVEHSSHSQSIHYKSLESKPERIFKVVAKLAKGVKIIKTFYTYRRLMKRKMMP